MIVVFQATPATPMPLFVAAATVPATAVPWPRTSLVLDVLLRKFQPGTSFELRSGCVPSTPESITATTTEDDPVVTPQAAGAEIAARCHCELRSGSLGVTEAVC